MATPDKALDLLLAITTRLGQDMDAALADLDLTPARTHLLWEVAQGPLAQAEVARRLGVTPRNVTGLVDALEADGFVTREAHPTDRRVQLVTPTPRGSAVVEVLVDGRSTLATQLFGSLPPPRLDDLTASLADVRNRLVELLDEP